MSSVGSNFVKTFPATHWSGGNSDFRPAGTARLWPVRLNRQSRVRLAGFTLIELLVVISILGILAGLAVPAIKNLAKSNVNAGAARQLLDDVARARQLAVSHHTTVYMMFVPPNYWLNQSTTIQSWPVTTNLSDKQYSGYMFMTLRSAGDQPGQGVPRFLAEEWHVLPEGSFIATNKFNAYNFYPGGTAFYIKDQPTGTVYPIHSFYYTNTLPFPTETNVVDTTVANWQPYIAFNYLGQLTANGVDGTDQDEYIPLAQGVVAYAHDVNKALILGLPDAAENPPGNSTNSMYNLIRIDHLTGRATLLVQKMP